MIVRCILPISIVDSEGFRIYLKQLDPQFSISNVYALKYGALTSLMLEVNNQIEQELSQIPYCNISLDLWSDAIMRSFNAVI
jgi:hypothetical protein